MQRNSVFRFVENEFGTKPEYLWARFPDFAVLRSSGGKWYGIIMDIPRSKLNQPGDDIVDVLVVKCDPILIGSLRQKPGYYPAYHMNKEKWISIALDGTVPVDEVQELIRLSYSLTR